MTTPRPKPRRKAGRKVYHGGGLFPPSEGPCATLCGRRLPYEQMAVIGGPDITCKACLRCLPKRRRRWTTPPRRPKPKPAPTPTTCCVCGTKGENPHSHPGWCCPKCYRETKPAPTPTATGEGKVVVKSLLDIIHDDLTHARQRDHAEAIGAARRFIGDTK